jgi:hypothetical protein
MRLRGAVTVVTVTGTWSGLVVAGHTRIKEVCSKNREWGDDIHRASILAESQTALKLCFNRPDQNLARPEPADHFANFFVCPLKV